MNKTVFKVGMKVYDEVNFPKQELEVVEIAEDSSIYPVRVKETDENYEDYTCDGRYFDHCIPTLSTTPYKVHFEGFSQEPQLNITKGQVVWVRDSEDMPWQISHFVKMNTDKQSDMKFGVSGFNDSERCSHYRYLTTENPYECKE